MFGYTDAVSIATIGAGTVTYIVGPVTGAALGASSEVMAIKYCSRISKSVLVMVGTPFIAKYIGLNNPLVCHGLWRFNGNNFWCNWWFSCD